METFSTKNGLSIFSATGFSSLRDELPEFRHTGVENDRQPLKNLDVSSDLIEGE
jgi:hypothetical protein